MNKNIVSRNVHPYLVDVFFGEYGFRSQERVRCSLTKTHGWKIVSLPTLKHKDEYEYGCCVSITSVQDAIHEHLVRKYGTKR